MKRASCWLGILVSSTPFVLACAKGAEADGAGLDTEADASDLPDSDIDASASPETGAEAGNEEDAAEPDGPANPCEGVTCNDPPANTCADAQQLTVFDTNGACDNATCHYASHLVSCPQGCAQDACVGDPCVGVTCQDPPANFCADATHLSVYGPSGHCSGGVCSYDTHSEYCSYGCANDVCDGDPCAGVSCTAPPANYCTDDSHLEVYASPGACLGAACQYTHHNEFCSFGCLQGACEGDPCLGMSCTSPPSSYCVDTGTLKQYEATGACTGGSCDYQSSNVNCAFGCDNGVCKQCAVQADCSGGAWCNGGVCQTCSTSQHCGSSCTDCTALSPAQTCDGTGTSCIECAIDAQCSPGNWCSNNMCSPCNTSAHCGSSCVACTGATPDCDGAACVCLSGSCGPPCPTALSIGLWDAGDDGWTYDGLWKRASGSMTAGSTTKYNTSYTQNLTYGSDVSLGGCASATLSFQVRLADDPNYDQSVDKSERLYVQCSGDGGGSWTNLTPSSWPANQAACSTSYCSGGYGSSRAFPLTSQTITLPGSCVTATARFRFQAKGTSVWRLQNPGWYVDNVKVN